MNQAASDIPVLWDGQACVVVRKPAGLLTQAPAGIDSLEQRLREQFQTRSNYVAAVHRLDRPVSGLLLVGLTKRATRLLSQQFASGRVEKTYLAVVSGAPNTDGALWVDWIRKEDGLARATVVDETSGKRAETRVEILERSRTINRTLMKLQPRTGRMHQLRVQASSRGYPILADDLYGGEPLRDWMKGRIALHAHSLVFRDPRSGIRVHVESPAADLSGLVRKG